MIGVGFFLAFLKKLVQLPFAGRKVLQLKTPRGEKIK
jgi:hypothetical protein